MAGDGNYGGNGSIYWQMRHAGPNGRAGQTRHRVERARGCVTGRDPKLVRANGATRFRVTLRFSTSPVGSYSQAAKAAPGFLRQQERRKRLIVRELDRIARAAQRQAARLRDGGEEANLRIFVPVISRPEPPQGAPRDPWEVNVHW